MLEIIKVIYFTFNFSFFTFSAKQVLELAGSQQTTFTDLMAQMGLAASLKPDSEFTLLAPLNDAFSGKQNVYSMFIRICRISCIFLTVVFIY